MKQGFTHTRKKVRQIVSRFMVLSLLAMCTAGNLMAQGTEPIDSDNDGRLEIANKQHLLYLSENPNAVLSADYEQTSDIVFTDADFQPGGDFYNNGKGFNPIGEYNFYNRFSGTYRGQNHKIEGLYINRPEQSTVGFFGGAVPNLISNLHIIDADIRGNDRVGALIGIATSQYGEENEVRHCTASGIIESTGRFVGGLIGSNQAVVDSCHSDVVLPNTDAQYMGGLIGTTSGTVKDSYAVGHVSGYSHVGGLAGRNTGDIRRCYATGDVYGLSYVGGLIGKMMNTDYGFHVEDSYARGDVTATSARGGGLIGWATMSSTRRCYATGNVSGTDLELGGLVGRRDYAETAVLNSFWDIETSGQSSSDGGTGKTTSEMKDVATFTDLATDGLEEAWDFENNPNNDSNNENIWKMEGSEVLNDGYPILAWQEIPLEAPTISTLSMAIIRETSAVARGHISDLGYPTPTQHGVCYNRTGNPTLDDEKTEQGPFDSPAIFLAPIDDLLPDRAYYLKAYAINDVDTVFGEEVSFTTDKQQVYIGGSFAAADKSYDATTEANIAENNLMLVDAANEDDVTLENVVVEFASASPGEDIEVNIVNAELGGDDSEHYEFHSWAIDNAPTSQATITKKELTVTAGDQEREQCAENPEFTFTYSGFLDGQDESFLTTEPVADCEATPSSIPGAYDITLSGGADENYAFNYVNGTLTIIADTTNPIALTQDITVELNENGEASITAAQVDNGSSDNCGIDEMVVMPSTFGCAHLGQNTVSLIVTDAEGNESSEEAVVTVKDNIAPIAVAQNLTVELDAAGTASITPEMVDNGSSDNCSIEQLSLNISQFDCSNPGENEVTLMAEDAAGNQDEATAVITVEDNLAPEVVTQPVTLYLDMSGEATLTPEMLDNGSTDNCGIADMEVDMEYFSCGDTGEHEVSLTASDNSGNSTTVTETVTVIDDITPSEIVVEVSDLLCYESYTGNIEIIPQDGSGDVLYSVDNGNTWQDDGLFTDLPDGTYNIAVEGANGCQTVYENNPVTLIQPEELVMDMVETTDATCYGASNGMLEAQASGGTGELYYSIDGGDTWQMNDGFFYGLSAGDYNVLVKDANDCLLDYAGNPVVISQPDAVVIEGVVANDITCNSAANGTIEINAFGGTGQLEYSINGGDTWQESPLFEGLAPGTYSIRVRDDNACLNIYDANPVTLTQPEALSFANVEVSDNTCYESNDGAIIADAQGGSGALEYSIDGGDTWQSDGSFEELPAGSYILMVQDENGCQFACEMNPITITQPEELVLSGVEATDITCYGQDNGTIEIFAGGGTGTLTYSIDDGANWQSSGEFTGLGEGAYDVWVKDANSCMTPWPENPVNITEPQELAFVDVSVSDVSCHGDEDGRIEVTGQGGTGALSYSINDGQSYMAVTTFDELEPGDYNLWMQDANGCTLEYGDNPITIENPEPLEVAINAEPGSDVLVGDTVTLSASTNYIVNYDWQPGGQSSAAIAVSSQEAGEQNYSVTVTNANNCTAMASQSIVFAVPTGVELDEAQAKIIVMPNPSDGRFAVAVQGINFPVNIAIFDGTGNLVVHKEDLRPQQGSLEQSFNFSQRANGMYYIKVMTENNQWVKKLVIQR